MHFRLLFQKSLARSARSTRVTLVAHVGTGVTEMTRWAKKSQTAHLLQT